MLLCQLIFSANPLSLIQMENISGGIMITSMTKFLSLLLSFTLVVQVNAVCRSNKVNYAWRPAQIPVSRVIPQPKIPTIPSLPEVSPEAPQTEVVDVEFTHKRKKRGFFSKTFNSPEKKYALVGGIVGLATMAAIVASSLRNRSNETFEDNNDWTANEISWPEDRPAEQQEWQPQPEQDDTDGHNEEGNGGSPNLVTQGPLYSPAEDTLAPGEQQAPIVSWDEAKALVEAEENKPHLQKPVERMPVLSPMVRLALQGARGGITPASRTGFSPAPVWKNQGLQAEVPTLSQVAVPRMPRPRLGGQVPAQGIRPVNFRSIPMGTMVGQGLRLLRRLK